MYSQNTEILERRFLFAGVTMIMPAFDGPTDTWVQTEINAIAARLGGNSNVAEYYMTVGRNSDNSVGVKSVAHVGGTATTQTAPSGEVLIILDYRADGVSTTADYGIGYIGKVIADFYRLANVDGIRLAELPMHLIADSRSTALIDEISRSLGQAGVWVDQETYLDPHPAIDELKDPPNTIYDNVAFVDNYWRTDFDSKNDDNDGAPVAGAYNLNAQWLQDHHDGYFIAHLAPTGYYTGTIDFNATNGGDAPIYSDWYDTSLGRPARNQTGYLYSRIAGGARPLSGVWAASGGSGTRTATGSEGVQWANVADVSVTNGGSVPIGNDLNVSFIRQDRDDDSTITFYLDTDQNPYNNNFAKTLGTADAAASDSISSATKSLATDGAAQGNYFVAAAITDGQGHVRFGYSRLLTLTAPSDPPPPPPPENPGIDSNGTLKIVGTSGNDSIKVFFSGGKFITLFNGVRDEFDDSEVNAIAIYGGDGNDVVTLSAAVMGSKVSGGNGDDRLYGGDGNDILDGGNGSDRLSGGNGSDRLFGGAGRDGLTGGAANDKLWGGSEKDWFVGAKDYEILDLAVGESRV